MTITGHREKRRRRRDGSAGCDAPHYD